MDNSGIMENCEHLGCYISDNRGYFSIYATHAFAMVLEVYSDAHENTPMWKQVIDRQEGSHYFKACVPDVHEGMYYVWRIMNEDYGYTPTLMDPYAKGVIYIKGEWRNLVVAKYRKVHKKPSVPWQQTIIYELHVGHFTRMDEQIPIEERGTFKGLIRKIPYLKQLGVTTLELLPIFKWYAHTLKNRNPYSGEVLEDVWGYNTLAFFALDERYSIAKTSEASLQEFKLFLSEAHDAGLEVLLDVVYNHSGEGGEDGVKIHFKYLAPEVYYKFNDAGKYLNCSGTGNTLNTNHPIVKEMIKKSLTYWADEIGVDGFRFDLASILGQDEKGRWLKDSLLNEIANDPILSKVKLITEGWDAKGSYDVGRMPAPFCEWSDYFRDTIRKFVRGDQGIVPSVADCMMGKEIYFTDSRKDASKTIHFITAHDGFTMWDLVSYNQKQNEMNGENNRDGHNGNYSYNWGIEGPTDREDILEARKRAVCNLMSILLLSKGTPMLLMGDEFGRTQQGNNNAFCQDNELVWVDWRRKEQYQSIWQFIKRLIELRKSLDYFKGDSQYEISWHGIHYKQPDWSYYSRSIACLIKGKQSLFFIANNYYEALTFELPPIASKWRCLVNSAYIENDELEVVDRPQYEVKAYSVCLFQAIPEIENDEETENQEKQ